MWDNEQSRRQNTTKMESFSTLLKKELHMSMKKPVRWISSLLVAGCALSVHAQSVWTYEVIRADNTITTSTKPPMDISYPPANVKSPVAYGNERQETVLTAQEAAARMRAPKLIIFLGPGTR